MEHNLIIYTTKTLKITFSSIWKKSIRMQEEITCPSCAKHQQNTVLELKQIHLNSAVYMCPSDKCQYPKGHSWLLVNRPFEEFMQIVQQKKEKKKKDKRFMKNALKKQSNYDSNALSNVLDDLNKIHVNTDLVDVNVVDTKNDKDLNHLEKDKYNESDIKSNKIKILSDIKIKSEIKVKSVVENEEINKTLCVKNVELINHTDVNGDLDNIDDDILKFFDELPNDKLELVNNAIISVEKKAVDDTICVFDNENEFSSTFVDDLLINLSNLTSTDDVVGRISDFNFDDILL